MTKLALIRESQQNLTELRDCELEFGLHMIPGV